ncbi:MAG: right-handed parallel beta-helix repeat-containing protein [Bdellovibrionales bacterium]|nr:right-handed parallel beta-helix repeat-containing protein [Bdellovibrionales bacterium]
MLIKENQYKAKSFLLVLSRKSTIIIRTSFALLLFLGTLYVGAESHRQGWIGMVRNQVRLYQSMISEQGTDLAAKALSGALATPKHIALNVSFKHYEKLRKARDRAIAQKMLIQGENDFVPATFVYEGKEFPVKIRLKGDWIDHLEGEKWSFRVKTKGATTLFGMKKFSLQRPETRNEVYEWIFHTMLKREDLLSLRYDLIQLSLNGKDLGIYAVEEHFEKRLLEHQSRREGPIVRFSEDQFWLARLKQEYPFPGRKLNRTASYESASIDAFQTPSWLSTPARRAEYKSAVSLLEDFRQGKMMPSQVFDAQKIALYFALCDLLGTRHANEWHNIRFYYDPIRSRLEPIGYDGNIGQSSHSLSYQASDTFRKSIFQDPIILSHYIAALERISQPSYLETYFKETGAELQRLLQITYKEKPAWKFSKQRFLANQAYIRSVIYPTTALIAYAQQSHPHKLTLSFRNPHDLPTQILGVSFNNKQLTHSLTHTLIESTKGEFLQHFTISLPDEWSSHADPISELRIQYKVIGTSTARETSVFTTPYLLRTDFTKTLTHSPANMNSFPFIHTDENLKKIFVMPGKWSLQQDLVFPSGYIVHVGPGTTLDLTHHSSILSYSPLIFSGSQTQPIVLSSQDRTGQGLIVIQASKESHLTYVHFRNLAQPNEPAWEVTGAVTFFESPLHCRFCRFEDNNSEDALNIIRSKFTLEQCQFSQISADALDTDFSSGSITSSFFSHIGNDGIDVSGSNVTLEEIQISDVGDKGISIGEQSRVVAKKLSIQKAHIGVAVKDLSQVDAQEVNITEGPIGIAVYQKKSEFGPGQGIFRQLTLNNVDKPYLIEHSSLLTANEETLSPNYQGQLVTELERIAQ